MHQHPLHPVARELHNPPGVARALGYRMPAEWEPIRCLYMTRPENKTTWPGCLTDAAQQFHDAVQRMRQYVDVITTQQMNIPTNDSWIRDYGPIFVQNNAGEIACHDFIFNCWGGKYEDCKQDDVVPQLIAAELEIPIWIHDIVLEGGSIDVNGRGAVLTTEQCLLNVNRNPHLSRPHLERILCDALNVEHVIWLPGGIVGDDTDGHIDDVARFIGPETVAAARAPKDHPDHDVLELNWRMLEHARTQQGRRLSLIELPAADPIFYDYPADHFHLGGSQPLPASYVNFIFANQAVFIPTFGSDMDDVALRRLDEALPEHVIVPIRCEHLIVGRGGLHCMTMQQPA